MHLKSVTYTSWARPNFSEEDLESILRSARTNNPMDGISGLLIFNGGAFLQILEGGETAVDEMVQRLSTDPRHFNLFIRSEQRIAERAFPDWSMAYLRVDNGEFVGEQTVQQAFKRNVPEATRNVIKALTHSMPIEADQAGTRAEASLSQPANEARARSV